MREIKFRAWKMHNGKLRRCVFSPFDILDYSHRHPEAPVMHNQDVNDIRDFIPDADVIEQFTGLKDKNGKEIYEGDILEFDNDFDDSAQRYVPYFDEKLAAFGFRIYGYQDYISESGSEEFESEMSLIGEMENYEREEIIFYTGYISIIGNIHENPELLEKEK